MSQGMVLHAQLPPTKVLSVEDSMGIVMLSNLITMLPLVRSLEPDVIYDVAEVVARLNACPFAHYCHFNVDVLSQAVHHNKGRNAPLQEDLRTRTTYATDAWDFYKPVFDLGYPVVRGAYLQNCSVAALDDCYTRHVAKSRDISVKNADFFVFHATCNKLVQKGFARLLYQDVLSGAADVTSISEWWAVPAKETYVDKGLEVALKKASELLYKKEMKKKMIAKTRKTKRMV